MTERRNPLAKERFLEGNRQRWAVLLILCAGVVLWVDFKVEGFNPEPYLSFLAMIGCVFLAGMSLDSWAKIKAQPAPPQPEPDDPEVKG